MTPDEQSDGMHETAGSKMTERAVEEEAPDPDEGDLDDLDGGLTRPLSLLLMPRSLTAVSVNRHARRILHHEA